MPGFYIHLAVCGKSSLENRSFVLGVEAPDILKKHVKVFDGIEGARLKYNELRTREMPEYDELLPRILQKERAGSKEGLHFGLSSNPDVITYWNGLSDMQKSNPFYKGYACHLLADAIIYKRMDIDTKFQAVLNQNENSDMETIRKVEVKKLHLDWDKTNARVHDAYPDVSLTDEVNELRVVQFVEEGELVYIDWSVLKKTIDYMRKFDWLNGDMGNIIDEIINNI